MTKLMKVFLPGLAVATLSLASAAKTPRLMGKMVAYDPLLHASKPSTMQPNKEVVILETTGHKAKFVKVVFVSLGTTQIDEKYFDGLTPMNVRALRNHECDENSPRMVPQVNLDQKSGMYLLTDAFKSTPPARIKTLECYDATGKK